MPLEPPKPPCPIAIAPYTACRAEFWQVFRGITTELFPDEREKPSKELFDIQIQFE
jgi:hypothetical protein